MRGDDADHLKKDILNWCEPVLGDRIVDAYSVFFGDNHDDLRTMARHHIRLWRLILSQEKRRAAEARRDLLRLAARSRLGAEAVDAIDRLVLDELVDVAAVRFQGSPGTARLYSRAMIAAATILTETRLVAA
ncbi:MAG: hypothetical protein U1E28_01490 [Beijerinckiaceae bacterium]